MVYRECACARSFLDRTFHLCCVVDRSPPPPHLHNAIDPIKQADFGIVPKVITVFLVHAAVTFFLVNNLYVSRQIKKISDDSTKNELNQDFMKPMKRLSNISYIALAVLLIIAAVADIMINGFVPNQD